MTLREAAQRVIEEHDNGYLGWPLKEAIEELKAALAEPVQEPVAYIHRQGNHWEVSERELVDDEKARGWTEEPLYTAPPQMKPLSEEEIWALYYARPSNDFERSDRIDFARAIERAHGIGDSND